MEQTQVTLSGLQNAWVEPDGTIHPVKEWGHEQWAEARDTTPYDLRKQGWTKLSEGDWCCFEVTQKQLDVIYDWHLANHKKFRAEDYKVI